MTENIADDPSMDPGAATDLADRAMAEAARDGIAPREIEEEVDSVFAVMFEAVTNRSGGGSE
ncbi:hypothetical protein [Mesorhizobium sp. ESP-6-2]|uniref:hypothetical protein n=1 Tax=Mesorhizobium sp. ESP-6-2 TaxID=2876625 RepID=UPI001CCCA6C0|nr:hypothetical protein [Mesorhizobium sp. ESP-6-2]MBZ9808104.1 hypothetical protein [Mesorhizobium sp. ESP-6-2]